LAGGRCVCVCVGMPDGLPSRSGYRDNSVLRSLTPYEYESRWGWSTSHLVSSVRESCGIRVALREVCACTDKFLDNK